MIEKKLSRQSRPNRFSPSLQSSFSDDNIHFDSCQAKRMFFTVSCVLFLCLTSVAGQTSVFEPYSFTAASCSGASQWSMWFDTNDPSAGKGDFEITSHIQQLFPTFMCSAPSAIEVRSSTLVSFLCESVSRLGSNFDRYESHEHGRRLSCHRQRWIHVSQSASESLQEQDLR